MATLEAMKTFLGTLTEHVLLDMFGHSTGTPTICSVTVPVRPFLDPFFGTLTERLYSLYQVV